MWKIVRNRYARYGDAVLSFIIVMSAFYYIIANIAEKYEFSAYLLWQPVLLVLLFIYGLFGYTKGALGNRFKKPDKLFLISIAYCVMMIPFGNILDNLRIFLIFYLGAFVYAFTRFTKVIVGTKGWNYLVKAYLLAGFILAFSLLWEFLYPDTFIQRSGVGTSYHSLRSIYGLTEFRLTGFSINPTMAANALAIGLIIVVMSKGWILWRFGVGGLFIFGILLTSSRLCLLVAVLLVCSLWRFPKRGWFILFVIVTCSGLVLTVLNLDNLGFRGVFQEGGWLSMYRLKLILLSTPFEMLLGHGYETGANIAEDIQAGAWEQGTNLFGILDSQYLWIYYQFGIVFVAIFGMWLWNVLKGAFRSKDRLLLTLCLYLAIISIKQYAFTEKSTFPFTFFVLGVAVNHWYLRAARGPLGHSSRNSAIMTRKSKLFWKSIEYKRSI